MDCGSIGDVSTVAGSNSVAVPCCGKKSRSDALVHHHPFEIHLNSLSIIQIECWDPNVPHTGFEEIFPGTRKIVKRIP